MLSFFIVNLLLLVLIFSTNLLSLSKDFDGVIGTLSFVLKNLETAPVQDLVISTGQCPENYAAQVIGEWPGLHKGCYCPAEERIYELACSVAQKVYCEQIPNTPSQSISLWKGMLFCVKRYDYRIEAIDYYCPVNYRLCNDLCIIQEQPCPVTGITVLKLEKGFTPLFNISRNPKAQPIVDFWSSINGPPCFDTLAEKNSVGYTLSGKSSKDCGKYGENWDYDLLDKQNEIDLYVANGFYAGYSYLPQYLSRMNLNTIFLNARKRVKVSNSGVCLQLNSSKFDEMNMNIRRLKATTIVISIMEVSAALVFLMYIVLLVYAKGEDINKIGVDHVQRPSLAFGFFIILLLAFLSDQFTGSFEESIQETDKYFLSIVEQKCFNEKKLSLAFEDYSDLVPSEAMSISTYTEFMFWFSLTSFLFTVAGTILHKLGLIS